MKIVVTGSSGHLGEALVRRLRDAGHEVVGIDITPSPFTTDRGSITDRALVRRCLRDADAVLHTATLHKPHIVTHGWEAFVEVNIRGTLILLEEAASSGVRAFVFTSSTSVFGSALTPLPDEPAAWITEDVEPVPKNIYGVTKRSAEDLCRLFSQRHDLPCIVLRTSRFFPDEDDQAAVRDAYDDDNVKVNEYLYRRVDLQDAVDAHRLALDGADRIGFGTYIVSATSPFSRGDLQELRGDAPRLVERYFPDYVEAYSRRSWRMFPTIDRVYVNDRARRDLGWQPLYDYGHVLRQLRAGADFRSALARAVGVKGYHGGRYEGGRYPTE